MRTLIVTSLLALALTTSGCKESDPNRFETHVEKIKDASERASGFAGLERLTKTIVTARDNADLLQEFVDKVIPVFTEIWDDAGEQQENMLVLLRDVARPEAAELWSKAVELDGSSDARKKTILALNGIKKAKAKAAAPAVIEELEKIIAKPNLDSSEKEPGELRILMAETLGSLGDPAAVPVLIKVMEQDKETQPVVVHRAAAEALGQIGDPAATDALLTVTFRVPDAPTTTNIGERAKIALASIGEPAVPKVVAMLKGEHAEVQKLAAENGIDQGNIQQTAVSILGAIGSPSVVEDLVALMPKDDCGAEASKRPSKKKKKAEEEEEAPDDTSVSLRAFVADALGKIGDPKASEAMCGCLGATKNPGDTFPLMEALARSGGEAAVSCLSKLVRTGEYDSEAVDKDFVLQPRWEAARFAILAATPEQLAPVKEAMASNKQPRVQQELANWQPGLDLVETCAADKACYVKTLQDANAPWFAREKAAFEVARLAAGDVEAAQEIAKAFKTRSPDARVSMAWLTPQMLDGKPCPECITAYEAVLEAEKMSMDATYQASVLMVRYSTPKLRAKN